MLELVQVLSKVVENGLFRKIKKGDFLDRSLGQYIAFCICFLKDQKEDLNIIKLRIRRRDFEYFGKCLASELKKDLPHAALYAGECIEMRKLFRTVFRCELVLEQIIIRLETLQIFSKISFIMIVPVSGIIEKIKDEISEYMPKFSYELKVINEKLDVFALNARIQPINEDVPELLNKSAIQIYDGASIFAEEEIKNSFPKLPNQITQIMDVKTLEYQ